MDLHVGTYGLDEAGRGALAGPLVATAVSLNLDQANTFAALSWLSDSKILSAKKRALVYELVQNNQLNYLTETIQANLINKHGIGNMNVEIFNRLITRSPGSKYIVDGSFKLRDFTQFNKHVESIPKADTYILPVVIAGIISKYLRDQMMVELDQYNPQYLWSQNKGYGTQAHIKSIMLHGVSLHHRRVFVKTAVKNYSKHTNFC